MAGKPGMKKKVMNRIYLLRHAEPCMEKGERRCLGVTDVPLSQEGRRQADKLKIWFHHTKFCRIYSSPLKRCVQTARILSDSHQDVPDIEIREGLREMSTGKWENLTFQEIRERYPREYEARGRAIGYYAPPGGESFYEAGMRLGRCLEEICVENEEGPVLVVTHAGAVRGYLCMLMGLSANDALKFPQPYAGITSLCKRSAASAWEIERAGWHPPEFLDEKELQRLYERYQTPEKVRSHMRAVAEFAAALADRLDPAGRQYDREVLKKAALVHDIVRPEKDHARAGARVMVREGYPELAVLVREHHSSAFSREEPELSMAEILFYADKRVLEDRVVTVEERFGNSGKKCTTPEAREKHRRQYEKAKYIEQKTAQITEGGIECDG